MASPDSPTGSHSACCCRHKTNLAMSWGVATPAINHLTSCDGKPPITPIEIVKRARVWPGDGPISFQWLAESYIVYWVLLQSSHLLVDSIYWTSISRSNGSIGFSASGEPDETLAASCWKTEYLSNCNLLLVQGQILGFYSLIWTWINSKCCAGAPCK